ncbi:MAG: hypothetical protein CFH20_00354 [Alphaproteobacteria bacterium MarineAlpha5_Bin10]|nr:MAG: hypothetical protein CFH20_00354 [Alphaproteobacteria bacterium MarineAlpha5_Bin10]|tara:strand:+ start:4022 stop:5725 length:1704 start_codon:yes stop_codon:yes gene_type:complete
MMKKTSHINKKTTLKDIMTLERMGARYPSRLSFSRSMLRAMVREKWRIKTVIFDLDKEGYGSVVYEVTTPKQIYSLLCFSQYLDDKERSDRVIADKWDTAYTLHIGKISKLEFKRLKKNIPLQEAGRNSPKELILSRANKSVRLFEKVVDCLSKGNQPDINDFNKVGYLLRTTAVYGSGKFGLSDFSRTKVVTNFNQPFRAEMLAVYIIREFSIHLVEHIAYNRNPKKAVKIKNKIKQHLGIGNSTGLGMAPFIIKHPKLIHKWIRQFEKTLMKIKIIKSIKNSSFNKFIILLEKSKTYLSEVDTNDKIQKIKNKKTLEDLILIIKHCKKIRKNSLNNFNWAKLIKYAEKNYCYDLQEIVKVQIIELYPNIADKLAEDMSMGDDQYIKHNMLVSDLLNIIRKNYDWALKTNFKTKINTYLFWYVSKEKLEPRLGERYNEKGSELEQPLGIGRMVNELYEFINKKNKKILKLNIIKFLILYPQFRGIIRRIQTLSDYKYGEVKDNILHKNVLPIDMLRFKLSFFGASRYDPKSDRWLRVSFFAGAPYYQNLNKKNVEQWGFSTMNSYK